MGNGLRALESAGQAVWIDFLSPSLLNDGDLVRLIRDDGVKGLTSNPSIFEKSIGAGDAYDGRLRKLLAKGDARPETLFEQLAVEDIQSAADILRPTYDDLDGRDGYVSLEVSPRLAFDTQGTVEEARRLWRSVDRPNLMVKVPGTDQGAPAIRQLIGEGVNVNVTLLFGIDAYLAVAEAHMAGLEALLRAGGDISRVHGVASFFVSRIDTKIDAVIDERLRSAAGEEAETLKRLRGKVAIANAKIAYQHYLKLVDTPRWRDLADAGAAPQRLLWASTSVKDTAYPDTLYADALVGLDTVDTLPMSTLDAVRDHGDGAPTLGHDVEGARQVLADAERLGLDLDGVTRALVDDGVKQFAEAYDAVLSALTKKRAALAHA